MSTVQAIEKIKSIIRDARRGNHLTNTTLTFIMILSVLLIGGFSIYLNNTLRKTDLNHNSKAATGTFYYVSTTGSDTSLGTQTSPFKTLSKAVSVLNPGDILFVMPGTYVEQLFNNIPAGIDGNPVTIKAFDPKNKPILQPAGTEYVLYLEGTAFHHITIDGLIMDAQHVNSNVVKITHTGASTDNTPNTGANHIRIINSEMKNAPSQGVLVTGVNTNTEYNEFINDDIYNNGLSDRTSNQFHGMYLSTAHNLVENSRFYNNTAYQLQVYNDYNRTNSHDNIVRNNTFYGSYVRSGIVVSGANNLIYNNVLYKNATQGITVSYAEALNTKIYNNTIFGNSAEGIYVGTGPANTIIKNNIIYNNGGATISNSGTGTSIANNFTSDPSFIDSSTANFHLQSTSGAIDKGLTLSEVPADKDGGARPAGAAFDAGAYEYGSVITSGVLPTSTIAPISASATPTQTPTSSGEATICSTCVTASSYETGTTHTPDKTIDNNFSTYWTANGDGQWIQYDLGSLKTVQSVKIAFTLAATQIEKFDIAFSSDGTNWSTVYTGKSSATTDSDLQLFSFNATTTRYVRIVGHGNLSTNYPTWNSLNEVKVYQLSTSTIPSPTSVSLPTSTPVSIIDTTSPTVSIIIPINGGYVSRATTNTVTASATDNVAIRKVLFYVNNSLTCTSTTSPYKCNWSVPGKPGAKYTIKAEAYDTSGNTATSTVIVTSK